MAASFVTSSLHLGHIATAMLPLCNNELTERCYHFGLTFVMKRPLNHETDYVHTVIRLIHTGHSAIFGKLHPRRLTLQHNH